jgi:methylated-DNA-[protein]-cysteine S-methyltransferase
MSHRNDRAIGVAACQTAFGWVGIAWSDKGLAATTLPKGTEAEALDLLPPSSGPAPHPPQGLDVPALLDKLRRYFEGEWVTFDEPLDPTIGTDFYRRVWALTRDIPRGQTRTYGQIARAALSLDGARAVGQAMARNPWPIIVPCHRVLGSDGSLTGFAGGVDMKRSMLQLEGAPVENQQLLNGFKLDAPA